VENDQQPIARIGEANFHTVLFASLALEMFCLTFLTFKLIFVPLFRLIKRRTLSRIVEKPSVEQETKDATEVASISL
jgi:hypothetical protein